MIFAGEKQYASESRNFYENHFFLLYHECEQQQKKVYGKIKFKLIITHTALALGSVIIIPQTLGTQAIDCLLSLGLYR